MKLQFIACALLLSAYTACARISRRDTWGSIKSKRDELVAIQNNRFPRGTNVNQIDPQPGSKNDWNYVCAAMSNDANACSGRGDVEARKNFLSTLLRRGGGLGTPCSMIENTSGVARCIANPCFFLHNGKCTVPDTAGLCIWKRGGCQDDPCNLDGTDENNEAGCDKKNREGFKCKFFSGHCVQRNPGRVSKGARCARRPPQEDKMRNGLTESKLPEIVQVEGKPEKCYCLKHSFSCN